MIEFCNVSYQYQTDEKENLRGINLRIESGEFIVVTGRSGCGKTTLSKCINGLIPYFHEGELSGDVFVCGLNTRELALHEIGAKVGSVFQDPRSQFFTTDTTDEVAFGCQNLGLPREEILERIDEAFEGVDIEYLRDKSIFHISSGEKQKIAIASCRVMRPSVYVLDEPSSNLDISAIAQLLRSLRQLKRDGHTVIILEHRLYYLRELADRVLYMKDGAIVASFTGEAFASLPGAKLETMGLRSFDLSSVPCHAKPVAFNTGLRFEAVHLSFSYPYRRRGGRYRELSCGNGHIETGELIKEVSFKAHGGEIIGITGKNGAGKTTLTKLLTGLLKEKGGSVLLNGKPLTQKERNLNTYFVMQDSDYQLFEDSVQKELELGNEKVENLEERSRLALEKLGLSSYAEYHPAALSRGQKQRLTIACGMVSGVDVLFFDEPTSGLDGDSMKRVVGLISGLAKEGKLILIISHDYEFLLAACTRILNLQEGRITEDFLLSDNSRDRLRALLFSPAKLEEAI